MVADQQQSVVREQFEEADAISRLEGYSPGSYEQALKERIIKGEIATEEFLRLMAEHVGAPPSAP